MEFNKEKVNGDGIFLFCSWQQNIYFFYQTAIHFSAAGTHGNGKLVVIELLIMYYSNYPGEHLKIILLGQETLYSQQLIFSQGWNHKAIATNHLEIRFPVLKKWIIIQMYIHN